MGFRRVCLPSPWSARQAPGSRRKSRTHCASEFNGRSRTNGNLALTLTLALSLALSLTLTLTLTLTRCNTSLADDPTQLLRLAPAELTEYRLCLDHRARAKKHYMYAASSKPVVRQ